MSFVAYIKTCPAGNDPAGDFAFGTRAPTATFPTPRPGDSLSSISRSAA